MPVEEELQALLVMVVVEIVVISEELADCSSCC